MNNGRFTTFSAGVKLILIALLLGSWNCKDVNAQSQARATIVGIPQILPSPYISDFEQNVFAGNYQVQLNITGPGPVDVRFHVRITLNSEVLVDETSLPATFDSGMNILSPFSDFVQFESTTREILQDLPGNRFRQAFQTGSFPEGNYQVTIDPKIVGSQMPGIEGIANFMVRYPEPPTLVAPSNDETISETVTTPVFSWSPVMGPPGMTVEYEFLLVEMFDDQTPADAIVSNREHASSVSVGTTTLPYTASYLPLEEGKTYAWQVTAQDVNGEIPIKNEGRSEIRVFTYGQEDDEEELTLVEPELTFQPPVQVQIPVTTISGTVKYQFRPTEGFQNNDAVNSSSSYNLAGTNDSDVQTALDDPNYSLEDTEYDGEIYTNFSNENQGADNGNISLNAQVPVYGGGETGNIQIQNFSQANSSLRGQISEIADNLLNHPLAGADVKALVRINGTDHVIASTTANENGAYTLSFTPSELDRLLSREAEEKAESDGGTSIFQQQNQTQSINLQNPNSPVSQLQDSQLAITPVQVVVDSPYFTFSDDKSVLVSTVSAKTYNAGSMTGTALTYRLAPTVLDREEDEPIPDATIEIFRQKDWYDVVPALQEEGWPILSQQESEESINGHMYVKVAQTDASGQVTRLFPRKKGSIDRYLVRISAPGYNPVVTHISSSPELTELESATIEKTYKLQKAPPMVEGRVVRSDNQAPIKNAVVTLQPPPHQQNPGINLYPSVAITDSDGRFTISNITAYPEPYKLIVNSAKAETHEEDILLNERGMVVQKDPILVDPTLITVVGRIQNDKSEDIANATVKWQEGGSPVQTDQNGRFVTANTQGSHVLQIRKIGHSDLDTTVTVEVTEEPAYDFDRTQLGQNWSQTTINNFSNTTNQWANSVVNTESFQIGEDEEGEEFSFSSLGYNGDTASSYNVDESFVQGNTDMSFAEYGSASSYFMGIMGENGSPGETQDIGTLVINRSVGKLDVVVESASDGSFIENATVQVGKSGPNGQTDDQGSIYFDETPAGTIPISVTAPNTTNFIPITTEKTITDNGEVTNVTIRMDLGGRATGTVTAAGNPVEGASVRVEGRDDINTTTASDGSYTLPGIPTGEWTLNAGKSGFVGDSQTATFSEDGTQTLDFNLQDSDFNIASLLGFEIEVDELSVDSDTTITGAFVSVPSNDLLRVESDFRIPFSDINVYEQNGELHPVGGAVQTDVSEFNAELFDFLQVTVSNPNGVVVRLRELPTEVGYIAGEVKIDYESTFTGATGWKWPNAADQFLELPNTDDLPEDIGDEELVILTSDGSFPFPDIQISNFELRFGSASETIELYGFEVDLTLEESVLKNDGFHMNGDVTLSNIPVLDQSTLTLQEFWIGTDGTVKEASLDLDPKPTLQLANWGLELASGAFSENGFSLGGSVEVALPGSDPSEITFSDLSISPDQIFGGQFTLPSAGVDLFGIVGLQSKPGVDITFGKVQNEEVYFVSGGGTISLPKYVDESLEFNHFLIRTDGEFSANIAANFETDFFGLADLTVNAVEFETVGTPSIYVDGNFGLRAIPFINAQAGGLTYQPGGNVSFDEIDLDFDIVGVANVGAGIGLVDTDDRTGFSGSGSIGITSTPLDLGIDFFYEKVRGGLSFGADVQAGIPPLPLGTVTLAGIGGGFEYNTSSSEIGVTLRGVVTIAPGTGAVVALDPLEVSVEAGGGNAPVIEGFAQLSVMSQQIADANLTIDFGKPFFDLEAEVGFEQLEDVNIDANGSARIVVSGEENNSYWMVGARYEAQLLGLFQANANLLGAWNLDSNRYSRYTDFVSSDYITGGTITGIHLDVASEFGIPKEDKECVSFGVGEACGWFYNNTRCKLNADFSGGNYGFYLGSNWGGGGNVDFVGFDVIGANVSASGSIEGSYYNNVWSANGQASAEVSGYIGDCNVGCQTKFCWPSCGPFDCPIPKGASLCVDGSIEVDYRSNRGLQVSLDL